jgi:hypothetical protein
MPCQAPITVKIALDRIWKHDYVLPAIQREFVWKPEQIYRLFDSLMQGFPVGSFLFWKIEPETAKTFEFFDFAREYHQRDNPQIIVVHLARISDLNAESEPSDVCHHQYSCGCESDDDIPEVKTQWVMHKISHFSSASMLPWAPVAAQITHPDSAEAGSLFP